MKKTFIIFVLFSISLALYALPAKGNSRDSVFLKESISYILANISQDHPERFDTICSIILNQHKDIKSAFGESSLEYNTLIQAADFIYTLSRIFDFNPLQKYKELGKWIRKLERYYDKSATSQLSIATALSDYYNTNKKGKKAKYWIDIQKKLSIQNNNFVQLGNAYVTEATVAVAEKDKKLLYNVINDIINEKRIPQQIVTIAFNTCLVFGYNYLDKKEIEILPIERQKQIVIVLDKMDELIALRKQQLDKLDEIEFADDHLEKLKKKLEKAEAAAWEKAEKLRANRQENAEAMSGRILAELSQLDMPRVQFSCRFRELELTPSGADAVAFYMSANAGEALKPLSKVASGGELARIMLAMKNVLAENDRIGCLIFDEVDTGVSGRAAQKVAEKLKSLARFKQVLCVTHLPQLAALADTHLLISKAERGGRTYTSVTPLDREGRKKELARIIGGTHITETTLKSAEEMLLSPAEGQKENG